MRLRMPFRRLFGAAEKAPQRFSAESAPRPIDLMFRDMYEQTGRIGREDALSVPAVLRGRNLICSISTLPLLLRNPRGQVVTNPLFEQIDPDVPNSVTLAQTVEDLLFEGISWWRVTGFGYDGFPSRARHVAPGSVRVIPPTSKNSPAPLPGGEDPRGATVLVDGVKVPWGELIRFDSPNPPLLQAGGRAIRRALALEKTAALYASNPRPLDYFSPTDGADPATDEEIAEILTAWGSARQNRATAYVPAALKYNEVNTPTPADLQLVELQKRIYLEIANTLGLDPEDLGISTTSRTYQNAVDRRQDRINDTLAPFMAAIADRLSMGDVTKRGYTVAFDLDDYLRADPKTRWEVYQTGLSMGALTVDEIRAEEKLPPLPTDAQPAQGASATDMPSVTAAGLASLTFADVPYTTVAVPVANFSVDVEKRTITGRALPYGDVADKGFRKFKFAPGSIQWTETARVKLLRDHDPAQPLGFARALVNSVDGLDVVFKIASHDAGTQALTLAADGVLDGLSVGVDFNDEDVIRDPADKSVMLVRRATLREVSLTAMPAFDSARVTRVAASITTTEKDEIQMPDTEPTSVESGAGAPDIQAAFAAFMKTYDATRLDSPLGAALTTPEIREARQVVNPTRTVALTSVSEALPYRFARRAKNGDVQFSSGSEFEFSADLLEMSRSNDHYGNRTDAGRRVMGFMRAAFDIDSADINELTPAIQRPDMYVDEREYRRPIWDLIGRGALPNGIQPFTFPLYASSTITVTGHTEGVEPLSGTLVTSSQTVTPTALSGKASITREVWDMGGNPAVSSLIWNKLVRSYWEGLEGAAATFLNTLTAASDIALGAGTVNDALADLWEASVADLQFIRGYDLTAFVAEKVLYKAFAAAEDSTGRPLFPMLGPTNANGTSARRYTSLDLAGVTAVPSWALSSTPGASNNSWLFDPSCVYGWATGPQRLEFPGTDASGNYAPVAMVDIAAWGYRAFACTDIGGVRQVTYDSTE